MTALPKIGDIVYRIVITKQDNLVLTKEIPVRVISVDEAGNITIIDDYSSNFNVIKRILSPSQYVINQTK